MRVAVLKGGRSFEREVSLRTGARVEDALERLGHEVVPVDVGSDLVRRLRADRPDLAFVAMHGADGEDGTIQELLEVLGIPYTGSGPSACVRCWDKALAKYDLLDADLPTPDFLAFDQSAFAALGVADALPAVEERLSFPIVVKPARQGSALGIRFAERVEDVAPALVSAFSYDTRVLLEHHVAGRELAVSVVDGAEGAQALPIVEAVPREGTFYDFSSRYSIGETRFECPADLSEAAADELAVLAVRAYELLGCRGMARVDLILSPDGDAQILEVNVVPGLTETSLLPMAADAAGLGFDALVARIVDAAQRDTRP